MQNQFESSLLSTAEHTLAKQEVVNILIKQNLAKYRKFFVTNSQLILDSFQKCIEKLHCRKFCCKQTRKQQKFNILYKSGSERLLNSLDIRNLIRVNQTMQNLVKLILDKQGRQLLRFQRRNILEFGGSASDTTDTEEELL